ncbi:MAG TPA: sensor histidine kinase KdpD [Alphaproteobacteria bacterium]|jgi:two-component system sensor histidine kinase KdpD
MSNAADRSDSRPSPEALLAEAAREGRGRLKIFLGAAPGVGKTYAMLEAAHRLKREGVDVLVGVIETHGRAETEALVVGLEVLPRDRLLYRGHWLEEFDLDAALARRPALVLVDELAHSNLSGARHPKRYQDVEELLGAGIDVYTTLNVQHLESLNDVVAKITRVRVRETLPDDILERADEIELVDITPQDLTKRLREGKVYVEGQAQRAVAHFFQPGNITALRELALRRVAERVDEQMLDYMRQHAIVSPWAAGERLLACVGPDADAVAVVRATRRLADQLHAPWTAVYVEMPGHFRLSQTARDRIAEALRLAEQLDGEAVTLPARDLVEDLLRYAQDRHMTQIVIGRRPTSWLRRVVGRSLVEALLLRSGDIAVHIVPLGAAPRRKLNDFSWPALSWAAYAWTTVYVGGAVLLGHGTERLISLPSPAPYFLTAVVLAAVRHGLLPSIFASLLSFGAYNFFFVDPLYTFTVAEPHEIVSLGLFLLAAILVSGIAARARDQAEDARRRMKIQGALYDFSRKLATTVGLDGLLWACCYQVAATVQGQAVLLLPERDNEKDRGGLRIGNLRIAGAYPPEDDLDPADWTAARWTFANGEPSGHGSATLPTRVWRFEPMKTSRGLVGVVGMRGAEGPAALDPSTARVVAALIDQTAVALERDQLEGEIAEARVLAATEKLRHALLSSISHDLRTPLAAIIGAISSLKLHGDIYDAPARADLIETVEDEALRLNRFVGNLLDMTRLEAGMLAPKRDWVAVNDLLASAAARAKRTLGHRRLTIDAAADLPLLRVDFVLMEQVLFNLIDNAAKYSADGSEVVLAARKAGESLVIEVTDQGRGIPTADLQRVFDKFHRIEAGDRQIAGTGLGLAVCRGIVEAHGGSIRALSPGLAGGGTTIETVLPLEAAPKAHKEPAHQERGA